MKGKKLFSGLLSLFMVIGMMAPVTIEAAEHEHDYTYEQKVVKPYTCTTVGMVKNLCSCGAYKFEQIQPHHTESYQEPYTKNPTCGDTGIADKICSACGELMEKDAVVPATGEHNYQEGVRPATCTVPQRTGKICTVCGQADGAFTESGEALGHDWGDAVVTKETCEVSGESVRTCKREGCNEKEITVLAPTGHDMQSNGVVEADCEHAAGEGLICKNGCGKTDVIEFTEPGLAAPALGHSWVTDTAVAATCEGVGYTPYHCGREGCGKTKQENVVPALGHKLEKKVVKPNCQNEGYSVSECAVCGYASEQFDKKDADPNAHVLVPSDTVIVAATCTTNGLVQLKCDVCNATEFAEQDFDFDESDVELGDQEINKTNRYKVVPAGHTWDKGTTTEATCTKDGETVYQCTVSDCEATSSVAIKALGHVTEEAVSKAATCGEAGENKIICTRDCCKDEEGNPLVLKSGIVVPATGEHEFADETVEPTCTEVGKVAYRCKTCGKMDDDWFEYAPALGHDWEMDADNSIPASCTQAGVKAEKCSRCDATQSSVDPVIKHNWVAPDEAGVTEDENGNDISAGYLEADCEHAFCEVEVCSICKKIQKTYVGTDEGGFDALGHIPVTGDTVEPTCVSGGYVEMSCDREGCDVTWAAAQTVPLGHDVKDEVVPANCKERGYTTHECSRCDYSEPNSDYTPINPNVHVASEKIIKEQSCTVNGVKKLTCAKCGTSMGYQTIIADHRWDDGKMTTEATCEGAGVKTFECASCDAVSTEAVAAKGHTEVVSASQAATCVEAGWREATCSVCSQDLGRIEIPATAMHDFQDDSILTQLVKSH